MYDDEGLEFHDSFEDDIDELHSSAGDSADYDILTQSVTAQVKGQPANAEDYGLHSKGIDTSDYEVGNISRAAGSSYEDAPVVMQYAEENGLSYPCVYVIVPYGELRQHQLMVLANLVKRYAHDSPIEYPIYIETEGTVSKLGTLDASNLRVFLTSNIFASWSVTIRRSDVEIYSGDLCLAFCTL